MDGCTIWRLQTGGPLEKRRRGQPQIHRVYSRVEETVTGSRKTLERDLETVKKEKRGTTMQKREVARDALTLSSGLWCGRGNSSLQKHR